MPIPEQKTPGSDSEKWKDLKKNTIPVLPSAKRTNPRSGSDAEGPTKPVTTPTTPSPRKP